MPRTNTDPLRQVTHALHASGMNRVLSNHQREAQWWELELECGHYAERDVKYLPVGDGRRARPDGTRRSEDALPPPKRVRCDKCALESRDDAQPSAQ